MKSATADPIETFEIFTFLWGLPYRTVTVTVYTYATDH